MGHTDAVDVIAGADHWADHLTPVAFELERRGAMGGFYYPGEDPPESRAVTVVASSADRRKALDLGRRPVLMQHGVGQAYSGRNASYPGGTGAERCALVLMPNEIAAARHRRFYPEGRPPMAVVGSPHLDAISEIPRRDIAGSPPVVAVTWHWHCTAMGPEGGTAWTTIGPAVLDRLVQMRDCGAIVLLGHAHPKGHDMVAGAYERLEVPFIADFTDIVAMADLLIADNTSAMYEFAAATDRPVLVLDSPAWRKKVKFPPRFWSHADLGPRTSDPDRVPALVFDALADADPLPHNRRAICEDLFPYRGEAARRAVDAILEVA